MKKHLFFGLLAFSTMSFSNHAFAGDECRELFMDGIRSIQINRQATQTDYDSIRNLLSQFSPKSYDEVLAELSSNSLYDPLYTYSDGTSFIDLVIAEDTQGKLVQQMISNGLDLFSLKDGRNLLTRILIGTDLQMRMQNQTVAPTGLSVIILEAFKQKITPKDFLIAYDGGRTKIDALSRLNLEIKKMIISEAFRSQNLSILKQMIEVYGIRGYETKSPSRPVVRTFLAEAIAANSFKIVDYLIYKNFDVNESTSVEAAHQRLHRDEPYSPLIYTIQTNADPKIFELFLQNGAKARSRFKSVTMTWAIANAGFTGVNNSPYVQLLEKYGVPRPGRLSKLVKAIQGPNATIFIKPTKEE